VHRGGTLFFPARSRITARVRPVLSSKAVSIYSRAFSTRGSSLGLSVEAPLSPGTDCIGWIPPAGAWGGPRNRGSWAGALAGFISLARGELPDCRLTGPPCCTPPPAFPSTWDTRAGVSLDQGIGISAGLTSLRARSFAPLSSTDATPPAPPAPPAPRGGSTTFFRNHAAACRPICI
jgi:hypothetical protein